MTPVQKSILEALTSEDVYLCMAGRPENARYCRYFLRDGIGGNIIRMVNKRTLRAITYKLTWHYRDMNKIEYYVLRGSINDNF